jgi:hypothetical protein
MRTILLGFLVACLQVSGQLAVRVGDPPAVTVSEADLAKLPRHSAVMTDHGKQVRCEGVLMHDLLAQAGVDFGKELHGKQLSSYVAAVASDDYEVVYALAEFDPTIMDSGIIVAEMRRPVASRKARTVAHSRPAGQAACSLDQDAERD